MSYDPSIQLGFSTRLTDDTQSSALPPKIFAQPFRLALKKGSTNDVTWLEVRSLQGLRNVFEKIEQGELTEIDRFSSVEMQLWGLMAEHAGFLRVRGSVSALAAGIQPLGDQAAALAEDLAMFTGGDDIAALGVLSSMQKTLKQRPLDNTPMSQPEVTHEFVKPDGINLTENGESALVKLVFGPEPGTSDALRRPRTQEGIKFQKDSENAIQLFLETPVPTLDERAAENTANEGCIDHGNKPAQDVCKLNAVPPTEAPKLVGGAAARVGRLVEIATRGFDNDADKEVRAEAEAAVSILTQMIEQGTTDLPNCVPFHDVEAFAKHYGTSVDELKKLGAYRTLAESTREARWAQNQNLHNLMAKLDEVDLANLVEGSQVEQLGTNLGTDAQEFTPPKPTQSDARIDLEAVRQRLLGESEQISGADHYKKREVTPASDTPAWKALRGCNEDPAVEWREEQKQSRRGPASMDTYRAEERLKDPYYGNVKDLRKPSDSEDPSDN